MNVEPCTVGPSLWVNKLGLDPNAAAVRIDQDGWEVGYWIEGAQGALPISADKVVGCINGYTAERALSDRLAAALKDIRDGSDIVVPSIAARLALEAYDEARK